MTLRTSLIIDGDASGATQATGGLGRLDAATDAATAALRANTAAQIASNAAIRAGTQARQNLIFQLNDIGVSLASGMNPFMVAVQQGSQLMTGPGGLGGAIKELGGLAVGLVGRFAPIGVAIAAATAGIAGMQNAINSAGSSVKVSFGDVALGALQTLSGYIWDAVGPAVTGIGQWFVDAWNASWPTIRDFGNMMIGTFVGAFDAMKSVWSTLPDVLGDVVFSAANAVLDGIKWLINSAIDRFNDLRGLFGMDKVQGLAEDMFRIANPYAGAAGKAADEMAKAFQSAMGNDYLGGFFSDVAANARQNAMSRVGETAADAKSKQQAAAVDRVTKAIEVQRTAIEKNQELYDLGRSTLNGLFADLASGLRSGVSLWNAFGDAAANAFDRIADRAMSTAADGLWNLIFGAVSGGFGGVPSLLGAGSAASIGAGLIGRNARGTRNWRGGPTWVGEEGPEIVNLPAGSQVFSAGESRAMAGREVSVSVNNSFVIDARGGVDPGLESRLRAAVQDAQRELPNQIAAYLENPLRRH